MGGFIKFYSDMVDYKDVVTQLVKQYLTMRYKRTVLGFVWTLMTPLLTMCVMAVVFSLLLRFGLEDFAIYLFSGLVPWWLFSNGIMNAGNSLLSNEAVIKKIYVPKQVFPTAAMLGVLVDSVFSTIALFVIAMFLGIKLTIALLILPVSFFVLVVFVYGLVLIQSMAVVYYRDLRHVVPILLQTMFYLTPILYPISYIPENYQWFLQLNPMYHFIELFHAPIYDGTLPDVTSIVIALCAAVVSLFVGMKVFLSCSDNVVFRM